MKIDDITLTLFAWEGIPATQYGQHTGKFSGQSQLGLLTIRTDDGVEGHAFLGASSRGGHLDAHSLIDHLKPLGAAVIIEASHSCMGCRGVKKNHAIMTTSAMRGVFFDKAEARAELMQLIK